MARNTTNQMRTIGMATIGVLVMALTQAPSLLAQNGASIQVSATVVSASPAMEAVRHVQSQAQRLASPTLTLAQRTAPEQTTTSDRLIQLRTQPVGRQGEAPDQVRMTLEYAAN